jgi:hypothetical protein
VLLLAVIQKLRIRRTYFFEISLQLLLVSFSFTTLHGRLLQYIFPIALPEQPLLDNNLTFNYFLTNILAYVIFPVLTLILLGSPVSRVLLGLKVQNAKQTITYALCGAAFIVFLFMLSHTFFGGRWITEYTPQGLVLWIFLVTILSVFAQTFFFIGILFNRYLDHENKVILALISILATQSFIPSSLFGIIMNMAYSAVKIVVTCKTRNIYGAALMSFTLNLMDIATQILGS